MALPFNLSRALQTQDSRLLCGGPMLLLHQRPCLACDLRRGRCRGMQASRPMHRLPHRPCRTDRLHQLAASSSRGLQELHHFRACPSVLSGRRLQVLLRRGPQEPRAPGLRSRRSMLRLPQEGAPGSRRAALNLLTWTAVVGRARVAAGVRMAGQMQSQHQRMAHSPSLQSPTSSPLHLTVVPMHRDHLKCLKPRCWLQGPTTLPGAALTLACTCLHGKKYALCSLQQK